jgi:membrane protein implicated in regulation of membrane protease activity
MDDQRPPPGPDAARAFRFGMIAGGAVGAVCLGALYWMGTLSLLALGYVVIALFPVYLIVVAVLLSRWLGYTKDITSLRPVDKTKQ